MSPFKANNTAVSDDSAFPYKEIVIVNNR